MIDLTQKALPNTVTVGGKAFSINTDYRVWMRFVTEFEKWDKKGSIDISYLFPIGQPIFRAQSDYDGIFAFAYPQNVVPRGEPSTEKIYDYMIDSDYIYSAFMQQYGIDLLSVDMHWHQFRALFNGISEETRFHEIMGYRAYTGEKIKSQDELYRKLKNAWELPVERSEEDIQAEKEFNDYFE